MGWCPSNWIPWSSIYKNPSSAIWLLCTLWWDTLSSHSWRRCTWGGLIVGGVVWVWGVLCVPSSGCWSCFSLAIVHSLCGIFLACIASICAHAVMHPIVGCRCGLFPQVAWVHVPGAPCYLMFCYTFVLLVWRWHVNARSWLIHGLLIMSIFPFNRL